MPGIGDFLVDTSILLVHVRVGSAKSPYLKALALYGIAVVSEMSVFEVEVGGLKAGRVDEFNYFFGPISSANIDRAVVMKAAEIHADLLRKNLVIGLPDTLIAATALVHQLPLLTVNTKHFSRVANLQLLPLP